MVPLFEARHPPFTPLPPFPFAQLPSPLPPPPTRSPLPRHSLFCARPPRGLSSLPPLPISLSLRHSPLQLRNGLNDSRDAAHRVPQGGLPPWRGHLWRYVEVRRKEGGVRGEEAQGRLRCGARCLGGAPLRVSRLPPRLRRRCCCGHRRWDRRRISRLRLYGEWLLKCGRPQTPAASTALTSIWCLSYLVDVTCPLSLPTSLIHTSAVLVWDCSCAGAPDCLAVMEGRAMLHRISNSVDRTTMNWRLRHRTGVTLACTCPHHAAQTMHSRHLLSGAVYIAKSRWKTSVPTTES